MLNGPEAQEALRETDARIHAIAQMHRHLFTTGSVGEVAADTYLGEVLTQLETAMAASGSSVTLKRDLSSLTVASSDAVYLGIIITEWVTNAIKYAYPDGRGEVRVRLGKSAQSYEVAVEDDGVGRGRGEHVKGTGLGTRVVNTIAALLRAEVQYRDRRPGTEARLSLAFASQASPSQLNG
jgi:two-component sensor histidine kinase